MITEKGNRLLSEMKSGETGFVVAVAGGKKATKRLADLGLIPGTLVRVIRKTLFSGPIQIEVCGSKFAIGKGLAHKIIMDVND